VVALFLSVPIVFVTGVAVRLSSGSPIFYAGDRLGRHARVFKIYKFRTMSTGSDHGAGVTRDSDPRVTPIGRLLRQWKLDELPQLINVLKGDMSVVGPRPESPSYLDDYTGEQRQVLSVKPGITGPTQLAYRHEEKILRGRDFEEYYRKVLLPRKLDLDLQYVQTKSLTTDIKLILATVRRIAERE
jgi:lipopolysaccharide/colanic/teichoic acid biosynthesis glycosyltransferase